MPLLNMLKQCYFICTGGGGGGGGLALILSLCDGWLKLIFA